MPTVLPPARTELSAPFPNPTNAVARTGMGKFYDYVTNLLGTAGTTAGALTALGAFAKSGDTMTGLLDTGAIGQVKFPVTQNPSANVNTLDDYAEGTWTPTITASTGTFTTVSATGTYTKVGRLLSFYMTIAITTNGTAAGSVFASLPFTAAVTGIGTGREDAITGNQLHAILSGTTARITTYNNAYPGANGASILVSGTYFTA